MKSKKLFLFTVIIITVFILSLGLTCTFCGTRVQINNDENPDSLNPEDAGITASIIEESINDDNVQNKVTVSTGNSGYDKNQDTSEDEDTLNNQNEDPDSVYGADSTAENPDYYEDFEKPVLKDNRFVIIIETMQNRSNEYTYAKGNDPSFDETRDYFLKFGVPQEQLHIYWGQDSQGGTYDNFIKAVNAVSKISNSNCTVLVALMTHGSEAGDGTPAMIEFADGMGNEHWGGYVSYFEIGSLLDQITCEKMAVIISSCALTDSVRPVAEKPVFPRLAMAPITLQEILNYILTDRDAVDRNNDKMISIKDIYDFVKDPYATSNPARYEGLEMIDYSGVADQIYLN